jgi:hypothetical protein
VRLAGGRTIVVHRVSTAQPEFAEGDAASVTWERSRTVLLTGEATAEPLAAAGVELRPGAPALGGKRPEAV